MEFLVEFDARGNPPEAEIEQRVSDEAAASADVGPRGHLVRLWKPPTGARENKAVGQYRAGNEPELDRLVAALRLTVGWIRLQDSPGACSIRNALESTRSSPRIGDEDHDHVSAVAAANHSPGSAHVHDELGDLAACPAVGARADCGCHLYAEVLEQRAGDRVSVECLHVRFSSCQVPVGPNRSVLIRPGSCPASTSASATASTNAVGPHT